ncbi:MULTISPECIES: hypothetical protein [unclassified Frankia]|uniref:hypothetical protein n=1 Tax=unclassified Frankia TaxID=2632575 RepID=UPI000AAF6B01|nr:MULTISPECIES: hypothetical protein [unclassified Frankia]
MTDNGGSGDGGDRRLRLGLEIAGLVVAIIGVIVGIRAYQNGSPQASPPGGPATVRTTASPDITDLLSGGGQTQGALPPYLSPSYSALLGVPTYTGPTETRPELLSVPESFIGRWQGVVSSASSRSPVNITIAGGRLGTTVGTADYPKLQAADGSPCVKTLVLLAASPDQLEVSEELRDSPYCSDYSFLSNNIIISRSGSTLSARWYPGGFAPTGKAVREAVIQKVNSFS